MRSDPGAQEARPLLGAVEAAPPDQSSRLWPIDEVIVAPYRRCCQVLKDFFFGAPYLRPCRAVTSRRSVTASVAEIKMAAVPLWRYDRQVVRFGVHSAFPLRKFLLGRAMRAPIAVSFAARDARAHGRKFPSGRTWVAPVVASLSSGARACIHVSQVPPRARNARAHVLKFFFRRKGVAPIITSFSSVRLSGAQGAPPRIAVAGGDGRSADFARGLGIAAKRM